jgi:hypothetical protein
LSAESGLFCRVITEGLFGINPVALNKFEILPRLPEDWDFMKLKNVNAFDKTFDIEVTRKEKSIEIQVTSQGEIIFKEILKDNIPLTVRF